MKRTQSSTGRLIAFTPDLEAQLKKYSEEQKETFSWVVRQACIRFLQSHGKSVDAYNPSRGERSDLRKIDKSKFDKVEAKIQKKRKEAANG